MNKKKIRILLGTLLIIAFFIPSISSFKHLYTKDKEFKMLYMVKPGETIENVAEKFKSNPKVIKQLNNCQEYVAAGTILKIPARK